MDQTGIAGLPADIQKQRRFFSEALPVYDRLLHVLDELLPGPFGERLQDAWSSRSFSSYYDRPLLLLASLRYDALTEGPSHPFYAPTVDAVTTRTVSEATSPDRARFWNAIASRKVQTNETSRAVAWLWPAHLLALHATPRDLALVDLGTSAGLNLIADELPFLWIDETGTPIPLEPRPKIALRLGLDIEPLDVRDEDAAQWLRSCVWPG